MELSGWGRHPRLNAQVTLPLSATQCGTDLHHTSPLIARGLGRSYGDSSLAPKVLCTRHLDYLQAFDAKSGILTCAAGVSLDAILRTFIPRGWFLPVTPGTRFVTVGGLIASDVHGKNHHGVGTFSAHLLSMDLLLGNGEYLTISPTKHADLFHATCGGMGLTGVILSAKFQLKPIRSSDILQTTYKTPDLEAVLEAFSANIAATYSVAWIDCLATGRSLGRSLLMLGEHATDGPLVMNSKSPKPVPFDLPAKLLNRASVQAFNTLYYGRIRQAESRCRVPFDAFFYPLDALSDWNRLYGKAGFVQYQLVLPKAAGIAGLREVLALIAQSGRGSFLAVLKVFGAANANHLSFPIEGYTLALDFKAETAVFELLNLLDCVVLHHGGRLYITKDTRMSEATFKASYPRWEAFEQVRAHWHAHGKFASAQSSRLGLQ